VAKQGEPDLLSRERSPCTRAILPTFDDERQTGSIRALAQPLEVMTNTAEASIAQTQAGLGPFIAANA
jgi:hypothetical protein